jgi:ubiquinone/menaquinone biosynthesis C-methylase UbiE
MCFVLYHHIKKKYIYVTIILTDMSTINSLFAPHASVKQTEQFFEQPIKNPTPGLHANIYYFSHPEWAEEYLTYCHRSDTFKSRWESAMGNLQGKVVVDIGCGPGNVFATVTARPELLIGVDVAPGSLEIAKQAGYIPVLADATHLPFASGVADIVTMNAALHHTEDMEAVLREAARIVKPGGLLITDHDPQKSAWDYKGLAKLAWNSRLWLYKVLKKGFHKTDDQQQWGLACEIHHRPGDGVSKEFFKGVLEPAGFEVKVFPHNHGLGAELFEGKTGKPELKYWLGNLLSGRSPYSEKSALSLMCVARKVV